MVFDTMIFAYALLGVSEHCEGAALALERADEIWVPDSIWPELLNVAWLWARKEGVPAATARGLLHDARSLVTGSVPTEQLWELAFDLALDRGHPAYDALFAALAAQRDTQVVTYDRRLVVAFPDLAVHASDFLRK